NRLKPFRVQNHMKPRESWRMRWTNELSRPSVVVYVLMGRRSARATDSPIMRRAAAEITQAVKMNLFLARIGTFLVTDNSVRAANPLRRIDTVIRERAAHLARLFTF